MKLQRDVWSNVWGLHTAGSAVHRHAPRPVPSCWRVRLHGKWLNSVLPAITKPESLKVWASVRQFTDACRPLQPHEASEIGGGKSH